MQVYDEEAVDRGGNSRGGSGICSVLDGPYTQQGDGTGGPGHTVDAEFNDRKHDKGVLSMARSAHPNSAGSQFFICLGREHCQHLDNEYTAFGTVIDGMDAVDAISGVDIDQASGRPTGEMPVMSGGISLNEEG